MVYINILKDSEYYADNFEERIITKNNCTDLISSAIKVFYGYICDTDESVEDIFDKLIEEMRNDGIDERIINYLVDLGAEETSYIQDNGVIDFVHCILEYYDEKLESTSSVIEF
jgi:hypothetical protein